MPSAGAPASEQDARALLDLLDLRPPVPLTVSVSPHADAGAIAEGLIVLTGEPVDDEQRAAFAAVVSFFDPEVGLFTNTTLEGTFTARMVVELDERFAGSPGGLSVEQLGQIASASRARLDGLQDGGQVVREIMLLDALVAAHPDQGELRDEQRSAAAAPEVATACGVAADQAVSAVSSGDLDVPAMGILAALDASPVVDCAIPEGLLGSADVLATRLRGDTEGTADAIGPVNGFMVLMRWPGWADGHSDEAERLKDRMSELTFGSATPTSRLLQPELSAVRNYLDSVRTRWPDELVPSEVIDAARRQVRWRGALLTEERPSIQSTLELLVTVDGLRLLDGAPGAFGELTADLSAVTDPSHPLALPLLNAASTGSPGSASYAAEGAAGPLGAAYAALWYDGVCADVDAASIARLRAPESSAGHLLLAPILLAALPLVLERAAGCAPSITTVGTTASDPMSAWNVWLAAADSPLSPTLRAWVLAEWSCHAGAPVDLATTSASEPSGPGPDFVLHDLYASIRLRSIREDGCTPAAWEAGVWRS